MVVSPFMNIPTSIAFEPYGGGQSAADVVDYGMEAPEIDDVVGLMRSMNRDVGCLYNQETAEYPQLFFSHGFKVGNALQLAREMRKGLDINESVPGGHLVPQ